MSAAADVVLIGAGHNALVCATLLARAGRRVRIVEASPRIGGAAVTREFASGYRVSAPAHFVYALSPPMARELELERHGLRWLARRLPSIALTADGRALHLDADDELAAAAIAAFSPADASRYPAFMSRMRGYAAWMRALLDEAPPRLNGEGANLRKLLGAGLALRRLGRERMRELLRIVGMNVADLLADEFENDTLRGALAVDALLGSFLGPRSPGSVLVWLNRLAASGEDGLMLPAGGMGALSEEMAGAARAPGVEIRTGARVERLLVSDDRVAGVRLAGGESLAARVVVSGADPRHTLVDLAGPAVLDTGLLRAARAIRSRGVVARLHLALSAAPVFGGVAADTRAARLLLAPSLDYLERAFNPVKYGEYPQQPALEISVPTVLDEGLAPTGHHVLSANVLYAPDRPRAELPADSRERFADVLVGLLERHAPGIGAAIVARELLLPADLEREFGLPGGHWHHGELAFDQFLMLRPLESCAHYATPLPGLWLCGAGAHPGGDVSGRPGRNAAHALLAAGAAA